jgi:hypothetical protein
MASTGRLLTEERGRLTVRRVPSVDNDQAEVETTFETEGRAALLVAGLPAAELLGNGHAPLPAARDIYDPAHHQGLQRHLQQALTTAAA